MLKIGNIKLQNNLILAPLHGVNCLAFRLLSRQYGASLVTTPLIHPESIFQNKLLIEFSKKEKPLSAQIVGKCPSDMARAAKILEENADIIDINLGCPDQKVLEKKAGAFLIKHPEQITKMVSKVVSAVNKPVTAKIRIGWDDKTINAIEVAKSLENIGIDAIAVHGRTRKQVYSGKANWDVIKQVKEKVNIPVIGNGDIFSAQDYLKRKGLTDFIMIGRGAIGNPLLFKNCLLAQKNKPEVKKDAKKAYIMYTEFHSFYENQKIQSFSELRQHAMWFTKDIKGSTKLRQKLMHSQTKEELESNFKTHLGN